MGNKIPFMSLLTSYLFRLVDLMPVFCGSPRPLSVAFENFIEKLGMVCMVRPKS